LSRTDVRTAMKQGVRVDEGELDRLIEQELERVRGSE
jgi:Zn-finger nucleic acid-binding protein